MSKSILHIINYSNTRIITTYQTCPSDWTHRMKLINKNKLKMTPLGFLKLLLLISFFVDIILLISYTHFISIKIIISHFTLRSSEEAACLGITYFWREKANE